MKLEIITVGKTKEGWIEAGIEMFLKRMPGRVVISPKKDSEALTSSLKGVDAIFLDPQGEQLDSFEFHNFLFKSLETRKKVVFVIGGAEGFPPSLREIGTRISLSKMTLTHEMALLFLVEQIYRSYEIERGSGYHK